MRLFKCAIHSKYFHFHFQCACCYVLYYIQTGTCRMRALFPCTRFHNKAPALACSHDYCFEGPGMLFFARFTIMALTTKGFNDCTVSMYWESCVSQFLVSFTWGSLKWPWLRRIWWLTAQFPFTTEHLVCHYPLSSPLEQSPFFFSLSAWFFVSSDLFVRISVLLVTRKCVLFEVTCQMRVNCQGEILATPTEKWQFCWGHNCFLLFLCWKKKPAASNRHILYRKGSPWRGGRRSCKITSMYIWVEASIKRKAGTTRLRASCKLLSSISSWAMGSVKVDSTAYLLLSSDHDYLPLIDDNGCVR